MPLDCRETRHGATLLERDEISFNRHARPVAVIHVFIPTKQKMWMAGTSPAMTSHLV
jgi:hypothetical protein